MMHLIIEKTLDEIKAITPKNDTLFNNFNKFLNILDFIIKKIKSSFSGDFRFSISLKFKGNKIENSIFQIDCKYELVINEEDIPEFVDLNILEKNPVEGLNYVLSEIKWE